MSHYSPNTLVYASQIKTPTFERPVDTPTLVRRFNHDVEDEDIMSDASSDRTLQDFDLSSAEVNDVVDTMLDVDTPEASMGHESIVDEIVKSAQDPSVPRCCTGICWECSKVARETNDGVPSPASSPQSSAQGDDGDFSPEDDREINDGVPSPASSPQSSASEDDGDFPPEDNRSPDQQYADLEEQVHKYLDSLAHYSHYAHDSVVHLSSLSEREAEKTIRLLEWENDESFRSDFKFRLQRDLYMLRRQLVDSPDQTCEVLGTDIDYDRVQTLTSIFWIITQDERHREQKQEIAYIRKLQERLVLENEELRQANTSMAAEKDQQINHQDNVIDVKDRTIIDLHKLHEGLITGILDLRHAKDSQDDELDEKEQEISDLLKLQERLISENEELRQANTSMAAEKVQHIDEQDKQLDEKEQEISDLLKLQKRLISENEELRHANTSMAAEKDQHIDDLTKLTDNLMGELDSLHQASAFDAADKCQHLGHSTISRSSSDEIDAPGPSSDPALVPMKLARAAVKEQGRLTKDNDMLRRVIAGHEETEAHLRHLIVTTFNVIAEVNNKLDSVRVYNPRDWDDGLGVDTEQDLQTLYHSSDNLMADLEEIVDGWRIQERELQQDLVHYISDNNSLRAELAQQKRKMIETEESNKEYEEIYRRQEKKIKHLTEAVEMWSNEVDRVDDEHRQQIKALEENDATLVKKLRAIYQTTLEAMMPGFGEACTVHFEGMKA